MTDKHDNSSLLSFGGHLEVLRQTLFRIIGVSGILAIVVFCFKDTTWHLLLAPSRWDFVTYRWIERIAHSGGLTEYSERHLIYYMSYSDLCRRHYMITKRSIPCVW